MEKIVQSKASFKVPSSVRVFEVGARDGLQNEDLPVTLKQKLFLIRGLVAAGVKDIELGAFVRQDRVPQMADTDEIYSMIHSHKLNLGKTRTWALVPNQKGFERAVQSKAKSIALFTAATEGFANRNIGMSIDHSFKEFSVIAREARARKIQVRGYVSTAFGCPFEGKVKPSQAIKSVERFINIGVEHISVGDTIGVASPRGVVDVLRPLLRHTEIDLAVHFHDTRGTALANTLRALDLGIGIVDSSAGGLGGCPFAPAATGNLATEDLLYMLHQMGVKTGIDLDCLAQVSFDFAKQIGRPLTSRYLLAYARRAKTLRMKAAPANDLLY